MYNNWREFNLKVALLLGCNQGVPPTLERCICSTFAQVCNPVGTVPTIMKIFKTKISSQKTFTIFIRRNLKVTLLLGCSQGLPPPPERCICSSFAQVCNPVSTVPTIMKIFKTKISSQKTLTIFHKLRNY